MTIALAPVMSMRRRRYRPRPAPIQATSRPSAGSAQVAFDPRWPSEHSPTTRAITSGRAQQGSSLGRAAVGHEHVAEQRPRRHPQASHRHARRRVLQPLRQPDRAGVRGGGRRARGRRGRDGLRLGHGCDRLGRARAVLVRRPHRRPTPDLRRHERVPARSLRAPRHRRHVGRRHHARRVRRGGAARHARCS